MGFGDPPRPFDGLGVRVGAGDLSCAIPSTSGASKGSERTETFKPCRNAFCAARAFPAAVLGPVLDFALARLARCWRPLVKTAVLRRLLRCRRHGIPRPELHQSLVASPHRKLRGDARSPAERCCGGLPNLQATGRSAQMSRSCPRASQRLLKRAGDFFLCSFPFGRPVGGKLSSKLLLVTKSVHHFVNPAASRMDRPVDKRRASHPLPQGAFKLASILRHFSAAHAFIGALAACKAKAVWTRRIE